MRTRLCGHDRGFGDRIDDQEPVPQHPTAAQLATRADGGHDPILPAIHGHQRHHVLHAGALEHHRVRPRRVTLHRGRRQLGRNRIGHHRRRQTGTTSAVPARRSADAHLPDHHRHHPGTRILWHEQSLQERRVWHPCPSIESWPSSSRKGLVCETFNAQSRKRG